MGDLRERHADIFFCGVRLVESIQRVSRQLPSEPMLTVRGTIDDKTRNKTCATGMPYRPLSYYPRMAGLSYLHGSF